MSVLPATPGNVRLPLGFKRVYFHHIRRVGGTSLNQTFFQLSSRYPELASANIRRSKKKVICLSGIRYIGANRNELEFGNYFYGFSHIPSYELRLPPQTFTITLFRDPVARVISHYRMVLYYETNRIQRHWMTLERQWLGNSFSDFCNNIPRERLHAQLFMFSRDFCISEAIDKIRHCNFVFSTERYAVGLDRLSKLLGLKLRMRRSHYIRIDATPLESEIERLRELMGPEYDLLRRLREQGYD